MIPEEFSPLLESTALALVSTLGPDGAPQTTPIWFLFEHGHVRFSLVEGRQKLRNLRRDPRLSVVVIDPTRPTHYLELRGTVDLTPDPELALERAVAVKYAGTRRLGLGRRAAARRITEPARSRRWSNSAREGWIYTVLRPRHRHAAECRGPPAAVSVMERAGRHRSRVERLHSYYPY